MTKKEDSKEVKYLHHQWQISLFLLLIFFLVTTTIDTDKGLGIVLPPPGDMEIEIRKENILNCLINSQGKVLLDEEPTNVEQIHRIVSEKIRSNDKLVISVKAHPKTSYADYVKVIDQLKWQMQSVYPLQIVTNEIF